MNPVSSLAPAVMSGNVRDLWVYVTAPFLAAALAVLVWKGMVEKEAIPDLESRTSSAAGRLV